MTPMVGKQKDVGWLPGWNVSRKAKKTSHNHLSIKSFDLGLFFYGEAHLYLFFCRKDANDFDEIIFLITKLFYVKLG
jgi:hypothetical protein